MTLDDWTQRVEAHEQWVRRAAWVVLVAGILSFVVRGGDRPANPMLTNASRRPLPGFPSVAFQIVSADKRYLDWCALLAATQQAREQGLMGQSDLRGYEAMLFRFPAETDTVYYMFGTTLPLSIAWFDGDGAFVAAKDMDPCGESSADACPDYVPPRKYRYALEVARGDLERLGIGPGSKIAFPYESCV